MAPEKRNAFSLQSLPQDMVGEILAKVRENSAQDYCNAVQTCKVVHSYANDPAVLKTLKLTPFVHNPLTAYDRMQLIKDCVASGNMEAHYVEGILAYFVAEDRVKGLDHFRFAADKGHPESIYLYGILMMCNGHFEDGKKYLWKITSLGGSTLMEECCESVRVSMHGAPFLRKGIYYTSLRKLKPPSSCHRNDLKNSCELCVGYKKVKKFIYTL